MQFPERDLTNQYISSSYQNAIQKYSATSSITYILDGVGDVIFGIPTASVGQIVVTQDQTASYSNISSLSLVADVALLADTSSYTIGLPSIKSGFISSASFHGQPFSASVVFSNPFASDYSITFGCDDAIIFTVNTKNVNGFVVNSNTDTLFSGSLYWQAIIFGEFN